MSKTQGWTSGGAVPQTIEMYDEVDQTVYELEWDDFSLMPTFDHGSETRSRKAGRGDGGVDFFTEMRRLNGVFALG